MAANDDGIIDLANNIFQGSLVLEDPFIELRYDTWNIEEFWTGFKMATTNLDRVRAIYNSFPRSEFEMRITMLNEGLRKESIMASVLENMALEFLGEALFVISLRCINLALAFTPGRSEGKLNQLYAAQSIILRRWHESPATRKNVEQISYVRPGPGIVKMIQLSSEQTEQTPYQKVRSTEIDEKFKADSYVKLNINVLKWDINYCSNCLKEIRATTPCSLCVFVAYCGDECLKADFKVHQYECPCMPYLHAVRAESNTHLALKAISKAGPTVLYRIYCESKKLQPSSEMSEIWNSEESKYAAYSRVFNMTSEISEGDNLPNASWLSLSITQFMNLKSDFFNITDNYLERKEFILFVASAILKHSITFANNMELVQGKWYFI